VTVTTILIQIISI